MIGLTKKEVIAATLIYGTCMIPTLFVGCFSYKLAKRDFEQYTDLDCILLGVFCGLIMFLILHVILSLASESSIFKILK